MTDREEEDADKPAPANGGDAATSDAISQIGKGLKGLLGGLLKQSDTNKPVPTGERSFVLRYMNEKHTVKESDLRGSELPTVAQAFDTHGQRLGIDRGRERTYSTGEAVVDGNERVAWGTTYVANVMRSTKGN